MASLQQEGNGRWRVKWYEGSRRKSIRLGKNTPRNAERLRLLVEDLIEARANDKANYEAIDKAHKLSDTLQERLERYGLIPNRKWSNATLEGLLDAYFETLDVKPGTKTTYLQTRQSLEDFFKPDTLLLNITPLEADAWRKSMQPAEGKKLADATVSKRVKTARSIFREGARWGMLRDNPFDGVKAGVQTNRERQYFVTAAEAARVLNACPDAEWRLIFALSRYGGLRCSSEHLRLRWRDIDWERSAMRVTSPKTEHHEGGDSRIVPIFVELLPYLRDAYEQAPEGAEWVISRYRQSNANLRTRLKRIVERAGLEVWPRLFQNLRATRQTELEEKFGVRRACDWLGNSQAVAMNHYIQTTEDHFERAIREPSVVELAAKETAAPNPAPSRTIRPRPGPVNDNREPLESGSGGAVKAGAGCRGEWEVTPRGFEPRFSG